MTSMRLQRALARAGIASRRRAEDLIRGGRVRVNGSVASIGMSVNPEADVITVSGKRVGPSRSAWIALHKPVGYVVTRRDPRHRPTVFELLPKIPGLTYVGRLDIMSSGLLLVTTEGGAANRLMHPRYQVERTYRVRVHGRPAAAIERGLSAPIVIDGRPLRLIRSHLRPVSNAVTDVVLVLAEGRYRIVRRVCERLNLKVERLTRLSHGPIRLGSLGPGTWRHLTRVEVKRIEVLQTCPEHGGTSVTRE